MTEKTFPVADFIENAMLSRPLRIRDVEVKNRIVLAPMQMYSGTSGKLLDWHRHHLAKFALGGFGTVFTEALAVSPEGRNTHGDLGIWSDEFVPDLKALATELRSLGVTPAAQLFHAGPKASRQRPWHGYGAISDTSNVDEAAWQPLAPSPDPRVVGWHAPREMTSSEIADMVDKFAEGARRLAEADFDILDIHGAHGYLIHSFYSPLGNDRSDAYGGDFKKRTRFALEVAEAVRAAWPQNKPLFMRLSCVDGDDVQGGWSIEDTIKLCTELKALGVDLIDCSSRGIGASPTAAARGYVPGFQVPYASAVRSQVDIPTMAVGLILNGPQAEEILRDECADLICIARGALDDPHWALHALQDVAPTRWNDWPSPYGWWLERREKQLFQGRLRSQETGVSTGVHEANPQSSGTR